MRHSEIAYLTRRKFPLLIIFIEVGADLFYVFSELTKIISLRYQIQIFCSYRFLVGVKGLNCF